MLIMLTLLDNCIDVKYNLTKHIKYVQLNESVNVFPVYSKTCLKRPIKYDKTKVFKTNGSLMKVKRIAQCSLGAFCNILTCIKL